MRDPLDAFHPLIAGWFRDRFGAPTEPQLAGWPRIGAGEDVLIAAPTGSGKTLAAFLACLDELVRRDEPLQGTQILYISPLKALSNDVHRNLETPLAELTAYAAARGETFPTIKVATRTGDTPPAERAKLAKHPPHILVTTPESLFILLTSNSGRAALGSVRTVIVDEIHAIAGDKRGAHLAISLERLDRLVHQARGATPIRVGLSATQRPIERIARLLVGTRRPLPFIADAGHRRELDLAIEITDDELAAVASNEQFGRVYDRIAELVTQHRSTIVFVNTRRLVERAAAALEQRLGEEHVVAHHGSMSRQLRLTAEQRLKHGQVKCAVATASLELGIDVGAVDLVVQLGSPRSIATLLQRVGRSGHSLGATPKGRMFALTRDQLVECAALIRGVRHGNLDEIGLRDAPLDILAQQIVACAAAEEILEDELGALIRGAAPYAELGADRFEQVLTMVSEGVSDRRGRNGAHVHRDRVGGTLKGRRGARLAAITSGGAIPDNNNYQVVQWPQEIQVGTLDEDFAIESAAGDIFQLGNTSWRIRRIEAGKVLVEDAHGQPPTIPFWVGEAPARTRELSDEVSHLRRTVDQRLAVDDVPVLARALAPECGLSQRAAEQMIAYLAAGRSALGAIPRNDLIIAERFFDEGGGMQLVIHSPLGGRVNRAWGLALRKKFCRTFDFELQAAATDDGIVISLGQPHSFALETVFGFVPAHQAEDVLIQALLDRPMFEIRWRWNVTRSLVVLRRKNGKKIPPHLIKMRAADTLSVVFPQAQACPENLPGSLPGMPGDREIPDHPLVFETIRDCLVEAMDVSGLRELIERLERGDIQVMARDTVEPSPLCHELINANPYAYLDDAPLEERRTRAVSLRRGLPSVANDDAVGALDEAAIAAATEEVAPTIRDADELHDAMLGLWLVPEDMGIGFHAVDWFEGLAAGGRACRVTWQSEGVDHAAWVATERLGAVRAMLGEDVACTPMIATPSWAARYEREAAIAKTVSAHLDHGGPFSTRALAARLGLPIGAVLEGLLALEADGGILRGTFTKGASLAATSARDAIAQSDDTSRLHDLEWCNRRVLARIHRMTLARLRREIEPVSAAALQRFLLRWQRVAKNRQLIGADGLARVIEQLQGFETASGAWEREILPARLCGYDASWLDQMCLAGHLVWCRLSPRKPAAESPDDDAANDERADAATRADGRDGKLERKSRRAKGSDRNRIDRNRIDRSLIAPLRDLFGDAYDLADAGAEAARRAGKSRDDIAAAVLAAIRDKVPVRVAEVITQLVTATAMLRNETVDDDDLAGTEDAADTAGQPRDPIGRDANTGVRDTEAAVCDADAAVHDADASDAASPEPVNRPQGLALGRTDVSTNRTDIRIGPVRTAVSTNRTDIRTGPVRTAVGTNRTDIRTGPVRTVVSTNRTDIRTGPVRTVVSTNRTDIGTAEREREGVLIQGGPHAVQNADAADHNTDATVHDADAAVHDADAVSSNTSESNTFEYADSPTSHDAAAEQPAATVPQPALANTRQSADATDRPAARGSQPALARGARPGDVRPGNARQSGDAADRPAARGSQSGIAREPQRGDPGPDNATQSEADRPAARGSQPALARGTRPGDTLASTLPVASELVLRPEVAAKERRGAVTRSAPSRSAPLSLMLRRDVAWLRAAAAIDCTEERPISPNAAAIRDHLAQLGASFLPDLVQAIDLPPDEIEDALWELVGAGLATADGFASLRVLVDRKRGEVKSLFDKTRPVVGTGAPVRKWQDAIRKVRTHDRSRPGHALRSLPTAAGRWSLLPATSTEAIDAEASARQLLLRYGVVFRDLVTRESCLPPWRDLLTALRRLEARGEIRGGRFVNGFVGEQFALSEALDELRAARNVGAIAEVSKVAATDPLNLVGILSPGPRVPAVVGNAVLYVDGEAVASLEAGELVRRAPVPAGARIDDDLTYHPPPRPVHDEPQAALPW